jgi:hypothetical protein
MAKQLQKEKNVAKKKIKRQDVLVLERINYQIILVGLVVIIAGYFALSAMPWDNPIALNVAPILLVLGYCIIIPIGLLYKRKKPSGETMVEQTGDQPQVG